MAEIRMCGYGRVVRRRLVALSFLVLSACGGSTARTAPAEDTAPAPLTVFAAASLTEPFSSAAGSLPQVRPTFSFAGSQQLATQLEQGAEADVVATADGPSMQRLVDARLVDAPLTLAHSTLVIAVAPGNPKGVAGLADLARPELAVVLADPSVPAGRYTQQVLDQTGVRPRPRSLELDVKATLAKVTAGVADAAVVYATDVSSSGGKATAIPFPEAAGATVEYRIAVVSATVRRRAAEAFVAAATTGPVRDALRAAGFSA
jgi:molybdate transport system substrate-binding protein